MRIRELRVSYVCRSNPTAAIQSQCLTTPREAATVLLSLIGSEVVEVFGVLCLTTKHRVLCYHEVSRGTIDMVLVSPRDVFRAALLVPAACVVVGHNHPSGDPGPSQEDRDLTRRLTAAGTLVGISVIDHVIVGDEGRYFSFKETGQL